MGLCQAPRSAGSLLDILSVSALPHPIPPRACLHTGSLSFSVSQINKTYKIKEAEEVVMLIRKGVGCVIPVFLPASK